MTDQLVLTKFKYIVPLEVLRGVAAVMVLCTHLISNLASSNSNYLLRLIGAWGTEAVVIFFILSGFVIHLTFQNKPQSKFSFLKTRATRIYPILFFSIFLIVLVEAFVLNKHIDGWQIIGNILPVSGFGSSLAPLFYQSNPVIWSLSFEVFFYVMFAIGGINKLKINWFFMAVWFVISLVCIPFFYQKYSIHIVNYFFQMMAFSSIWITGFFIWSVKDTYKINIVLAGFSLGCLPMISRLHLFAEYYDPVKYLIFTITSIPFFIYLYQYGTRDDSIELGSNFKQPILLFIIICVSFLFTCFELLFDKTYALPIKIIYVLLPFTSLLLFIDLFKRFLKKTYAGIVEPLFSYIGKWSYSLYLIHFPIIVIINSLTIPLYLKLILTLTIIFSVSILLDIYFQPRIKQFLKKL